ncbi:MAG TPA: cytochrome c peroxidase [Polyangiaceae bacterium]|nr:cytochrome c peroxidase [Polyangiaceae bacterium]
MSFPRVPFAGCAATAFALAGCDFGAVHGYTPDLGTEFSSTDLELIRRELGSLAEKPPDDPSNLYADDRDAALLGQQLFFEPRYSQNGALACATCHDPATGFQDARSNTSEGLAFTGRHSATLINVGYGPARTGSTVWQFWDGRADSLWSQALGPPESGVEMGGARTTLALLVYDKYRQPYEAIFGAMPALRTPTGEPVVEPGARPQLTGFPATAETRAWDALPEALRHGITEVYVNFGKAIAAYERLIVSRSSRFDSFYAEIAAGATRSKLLNGDEAAGLKLFVGEGKCVSCHLGPNFTDWKFHNIGVAQEGMNIPPDDEGRAEGLAKVVADRFNCASEWSDRSDKDGCAVNGIVADGDATAAYRGAFKTPSLRSVSQTAPYFHTGTELTLADVVEHYDEGGDDGHYAGKLDPNVEELHLTEPERAELVAFLKTLDGEPLAESLLTKPSMPP